MDIYIAHVWSKAERLQLGHQFDLKTSFERSFSKLSKKVQHWINGTKVMAVKNL